MTRSAFFVRTLLASLALTAAGAVPAVNAAPLELADVVAAVPDLAHLRVRVSELPLALHRRAVDFLELARERTGSRWVGGRLATHALPMTRPGHDGPSHYEFVVVADDDETIGSFIMATDVHDHPVPVAVENGPSRSDLLAAQLSSSDDAANVYFFSASSLVVEDRRGRAVARFGDLPPKIERLDRAWLEVDDAARRGRTQWRSSGPGMGEADTDLPVGRVELGTWASWRELRRDYAENYFVAHEVMRRNAADAWDEMRRAADAAEGLQPGWFREIPLLARGDAKVKAVGAGVRHVRIERYERAFEGDEVVGVFVESASDDRVDELSLQISYGDGTSEEHRFAIAAEVPNVDTMGPGSRERSDQQEAPAAGVLAMPRAAGVLAAAPVTASGGPECSKVVLRSAYDTYVYAKNGGGAELEARGGWIGGWEIFRLESGRTQIRLRASNGKYVRSLGASGTTIRADAERSDADTLLRRTSGSDGTILLRTAKGHKLRARTDGGIDAASGHGNRRFRLEYCAPSRIEAHWAGANDPIAAMRKVRKYSQLRGSQGQRGAVRQWLRGDGLGDDLRLGRPHGRDRQQQVGPLRGDVPA